MRYLPLPGRILFALIFIVSAFGNFTPHAWAYAAQHGVPAANLAVPLAGVLALAGGLMVLFGFYTRLGAALLIAFLVPVTLLMHNFWTLTDPMMRQMQQINFFKNVSMLGGALLIASFGAGPLSVDAWLAERRAGRRVAAPTGPVFTPTPRTT